MAVVDVNGPDDIVDGDIPNIFLTTSSRPKECGPNIAILDLQAIDVVIGPDTKRVNLLSTLHDRRRHRRSPRSVVDIRPPTTLASVA